MLPAGQRDVLQSIYEWCYTGRPSYRVLIPEGELPKNFDDAACAFDRAAANAPLSERITVDAVPESMLKAEFSASGVNVAGALRALEDRGFLQVILQPQIFCGAWQLPDGRRFAVYGKYEPAEPGSELGGTCRFSYTLDGHVVGWVRTAETTFPRTFRATERGIAAAELRDVDHRALAEGYTIAWLREKTGLANGTLNRYAKAAKVLTARQGQRNFRYSAAAVKAILEHIGNATSEDALREKCRVALEELTKIAKESHNRHHIASPPLAVYFPRIAPTLEHMGGAEVAELFVSLKRAAARLGVPATWLRAEALACPVPYLCVGRRMLFHPAAVERTLLERAAQEALASTDDASGGRPQRVRRVGTPGDSLTRYSN